MKFFIKMLVTGFVILSAYGATFSFASAQGARAALNETLINAATEYVENNLPTYRHLIDSTVKIDDDEDVWIVIFEHNGLSSVAEGASPPIHISKETLTVLGAYGTE